MNCNLSNTKMLNKDKCTTFLIYLQNLVVFSKGFQVSYNLYYFQLLMRAIFLGYYENCS